MLRPTVMFCVPLILDRIYKGVTEQIRRKSSFVQDLVNLCINYRLECINRGEITPIMDRLIFRSIRSLVGGRVRAIMSGGAPLAPDTHDYLKSVLGCPILQGYGLTETSACAAIMRMDENVTGTVGPPVQGVQIQVSGRHAAIRIKTLCETVDRVVANKLGGGELQSDRQTTAERRDNHRRR